MIVGKAVNQPRARHERRAAGPSWRTWPTSSALTAASAITSSAIRKVRPWPSATTSRLRHAAHRPQLRAPVRRRKGGGLRRSRRAFPIIAQIEAAKQDQRRISASRQANRPRLKASPEPRRGFFTPGGLTDARRSNPSDRALATKRTASAMTNRRSQAW